MSIFDYFKRTKKTSKRSQRSFEAVNTGRLFADFASMTRSSDSELRPALRTLRNRCRELARNDEYVRRYLQLVKTNVVGPGGISVQAKARNSDGSLDAPGNKIVENAWRRWSKAGICTMDGRLSFVDAQRLVVETLARDGEVLIRKINGADNPDRFAIQFLEADLLDEELNIKLDNGNRVRMGVEIDEFGRSVAYHLLREHPGDHEFSNTYSRKHTRVESENLLHLFQSDRPHQTRGVPPLASCMNALKMLHGYVEAELVASRVSAAKMGFITTPDSEGYAGDDFEDNNQIMNAEPGSFEQLAAGQSITMFDPTHPTTAFSDFHKAVLRGVASSMGVSYASLASDLESVNYSSIRQGALDERDGYRTLQEFLITHFVEPIFQSWLTSAMTSGSLPLPMTRFEKFSNSVIYRPRGFSWVDPVKEINAQVTGIQNGLLSMQDVANHYGADIEDVFESIQREKELAARYGLSLAFEPFGNKANAEPQVTNQPANSEE
ncbi:MAG: phage portal protein [Rickettsiales bacterium]|nr:phage portal protein [Rickettsiales bacterium]